MYALRASWDYDPGPALETMKVPLLAVNAADDRINPPELAILDREMKRVARGRAVVIPLSDKTRGHGRHTIAALSKHYLADLLAGSQSRPSDSRLEAKVHTNASDVFVDRRSGIPQIVTRRATCGAWHWIGDASEAQIEILGLEAPPRRQRPFQSATDGKACLNLSQRPGEHVVAQKVLIRTERQADRR
jgi:hypothetical protein